MDSKNYFAAHSLIGVIFTITALLFSMNSMAASSYTVKNNFPANPEKCTAGSTYDDGEFFVYKCVSAGKLCATHCLVFSEDDKAYSALSTGEVITYDQEGALRCETSDEKDALLSQVYEDVTAATIADSKVPSCK